MLDHKEFIRIKPEEAGISSLQVKTCIQKMMHERTFMNGFMVATQAMTIIIWKGSWFYINQNVKGN